MTKKQIVGTTMAAVGAVITGLGLNKVFKRVSKPELPVDISVSSETGIEDDVDLIVEIDNPEA